MDMGPGEVILMPGHAGVRWHCSLSCHLSLSAQYSRDALSADYIFRYQVFSWLCTMHGMQARSKGERVSREREIHPLL